MSAASYRTSNASSDISAPSFRLPGETPSSTGDLSRSCRARTRSTCASGPRGRRASACTGAWRSGGRQPMGLPQAHQLLRRLHAHPLLHREAAREQANEPGQLGDADDLLMRDVADVRVAVERKRVVLAEREELDRALDDLADVAVGAAAALGWKGGEELGVAFVPGSGVEQRAQVPLGGCEGARGFDVHAERLEDLGRVSLELLPLLRRDLARFDLLPLGGLFRVESERGH